MLLCFLRFPLGGGFILDHKCMYIFYIKIKMYVYYIPYIHSLMQHRKVTDVNRNTK